MVLVRSPSPPQPPHAASRNCDTNACIKFIFDTAIDDLEWKNPIDFGHSGAERTRSCNKQYQCYYS